MSINSLYNTARLGLNAQQALMQTAAHNIANASTVGYTRQSVDLEANLPMNTPQGSFGTGVLVGTVTHSRDTLIDTNYRSQTSLSRQYGTLGDGLTSISSMYGEPSDNAFASTLDQFWGAWSDLANNPDSTAAKGVVQQRGQQVADTLQRYSKGLDTIQTQTLTKLQTDIGNLNKYSAQVASLNDQIVAAESSGHTAADLRDQRDNLLDQISTITPVQTIEQKDGSVNVYLSGQPIVDGVLAQPVTQQTINGQVTLQQAGYTVRNPGGSLGAEVNLLNNEIPAQHAQLDALAKQLVTQINTIHRAGWTAAGDALGGANWNTATPPTGSNVDFFDPNGVTAETISLSTSVKSDASYIAAGNVQNGTGNSVIANQMAQLRTGTGSILAYGSTTQTTSFTQYYQDLVTRLGIATNDTNSSAAVYDTLAQQANTQRQSANGVSTDDELVALTKSQQAYAAAAKIITTAGDMAQTLLDMIR